MAYFFPAYVLFRFSRLAKQAIALHDSVMLTASLKQLKLHYVALGIMVVAGFALYVLILVGSLLFGIFEMT